MAWAHWIDVPPEPAVNTENAHLPRLVLTSEAPAQLASAKPASASPARCVSIGPFNDLPQAARATALLHERGFTPRQRAEAGDIRDGFWVYVGGLKTAADEARVVRALEDASISDARGMAATEEGRRVSVGLFSERARAERRARAVQHLGFSPEIVERQRSGTIYWVDIDLGPNDAAVPTEGLAALDQGGAHIQVQVCPAPGTSSAAPG